MDVEKDFAEDRMGAYEAQKTAHWISQGPVIFQVARFMVKSGLLEKVSDSGEKGLTIDEAVAACSLPRYGVQVLFESSLTMGILLYREGRFYCSKAGWFLLNDEMVRVDMDFNHDVNYIGMFNLEEAIREGRPAGLRHFGDWKTIYEALPHLPEEVKKSWFAFDHYYSDHSFSETLAVLMRRGGKNILDVGGNTGRFALEAVAYDKDVQVTVMDLPGQIEMMRKAVAGSEGSGRIHAYPADLLDEGTVFPSGFDKIWMSQFLDCFGTEEVVSILSRAAASMSDETELYIMESFWDRQPYGTAAFALTAISLYFTVMANGNSKMYGYSDMLECVERAGLKVDERIDNVGKCHTILICSKKQ
ncbi:MAG: methyltransferase domain-containing protein [Muribaculum sp.]|uniref:Methyltransferase domain-containing protein n=1 Tax=Candidatus Merdivivens faecigallinarum TaxID=2840871 RepID=A0A9D9NPP5_9BACT|nr:methyltransferase domain-containing protein [Candidatus Merdivivens faecigallinarum]